MDNFEKKYNEKNVVMFSEKYHEYYKSITLGLNESFYKFVIPSFDYLSKINEEKIKEIKKIEKIKKIKKIRILDDCFGYGFNSIATIMYLKLNYPKTKIQIYSFEKEQNIITKIKDLKNDLNSFCQNTKYFKDIFKTKNINDRKKSFHETISIVQNLKFHETKNNKNNYYLYEEPNLKIKIFVDDLNNINKKIKFKKFDFIYHDPFSADNNPDAWTEELFKKLKKVSTKKSILTSYSSNTDFRNILRFLNYKIINIDSIGRKKPSTLAIQNYIYAKIKKYNNKKIK